MDMSPFMPMEVSLKKHYYSVLYKLLGFFLLATAILGCCIFPFLYVMVFGNMLAAEICISCHAPTEVQDY